MPFDDNGTWYDDSTAGQDQPSVDQTAPYVSPTPAPEAAPASVTAYVNDPSILAAMNFGQPDTNTVTGGPINRTADPIDKAGSDSASWFSKALDTFGKSIGWGKMDDKTKGATVTAGAALLSGAGAGYIASQKMAQEKEIANNRLEVEKQLAASQTGIAGQKMANQAGILNMKFGQSAPAGPGLLYNQAVQHKRPVV